MYFWAMDFLVQVMLSGILKIYDVFTVPRSGSDVSIVK